MNVYKKLTIIFLILVVFSPLAAGAQNVPEPEQQEEITEYIPPLPENQGGTFISFLGTIFKIAISLSVIIVFVYVTVFVLKMISAPGQGSEAQPNIGSLSMIDSLPLKPNQTLYMVSAGKEVLIIGATDREIKVLSTVTDPETVKEIIAEKEKKWNSARPFSEYMRTAQKKQYLKMYLKEYLDSVKNLLKGKKNS